MANKEPVFMYLATYATEADAQADYDDLKVLHRDHTVDMYDVAIVSKDENGKVHVHKHEKTTQFGVWTGLAVGAVVGLVFLPALLLDVALGAAVGGIAAHFFGGMSRGDVKELGDLLDAHQAALVIIGKSRVSDEVKTTLNRSLKEWEREVGDQEEFEKELDGALKTWNAQ